ncbi:MULTISPECIES: GGDEF domain-containing protein [unclassified Pseudoalteromonas]|uniref:GGDEF domain-containing protein n=1 Tax=unclassified Pseudoalteromonas TaxID=194690 RepID=UPI00331EAAC0
MDKKLKQAIEQRIVIESARKTQVDTLSNFAAKLSLSCKGLDIELDNRLAKFRSALNKGVSFEHLSPLINDILVLLKNQEAIQLAHQRDLRTSVKNAGKQLQKTNGLPDNTRRTLRNLLDNELDAVQSTHGFIPLLNQLITIYNQALHTKFNAIPAEQHTDTPAIAKKLLELAHQLVLEDEAAEQIQSIRTTILQSNTVDDLLAAAIEIISIIVKNINNERQSAQSFLVSLNKTLEELHHSIFSTSKHSESMGIEFDVLNKRIKTKINNLNEQTKSTTSISSLRKLVDHELKSLGEDFIAKEELERKDRKVLITSFDEINNRIGSLEKKLTKYKKRLNDQRFKSLFDSLTKLPNRAAFDERYNHEMHLFNVQASDVTLVVIDVDYFKSINDRFGHTAGDITLQVIAKALQKSIEKTDFIARYGGEEFVLLMPGTSLEHAIPQLEKLKKNIKKIPFKFKDKQIEITVSLGATQFKQGDTLLKAFDRADDALYEAKNAGRDRLCIRK